MKIDTLTQAELIYHLKYNKNTGDFFWGMGAKKAVTLLKDGYISICLFGKSYMAHRLAWLYVTGNFPVGEIDHIDGNPSNNSWLNLREANRNQNSFNCKIRKSNTTGFKGVERAGKGFQARIRAYGKRYGLGTYKTPEEASTAYKEAAIKLHGNFSCVNR
jgi:hypothetical protein